MKHVKFIFAVLWVLSMFLVVALSVAYQQKVMPNNTAVLITIILLGVTASMCTLFVLLLNGDWIKSHSDLEEERKKLWAAKMEYRKVVSAYEIAILNQTSSDEKRFSLEDMVDAAKYGYEFRDTTMFPEHKFEDSCENNFRQHIQSK